MNQYLITRMRGGVCSFLMQEQKVVEIHCDPAGSDSLLGNIYIGKIRNIAKNIGAAFVEIAPGVTCHLALDDMKQPVYTKKGSSRLPQAGDELLVQVSREGIKSKYPSVSTNLTLHGKYVLLTTGNTTTSVSKKISKERRAELLEFAHFWKTAQVATEDFANSKDISADTSSAPPVTENAAKTDAYGLLFRTNAATADFETLSAELNSLKNRCDALMAQAQFRTCYSCLFRMPAAYLTRLENLYDSDAERIVTDDEGLYQEMQEYLTVQHPEDLPKLALYKDRMQSMQKLYSLERHLEQALSERVWLKSGGYLVIQPTEALTVIDVNSGKFEGGKKREAAFLKVNLEAAKEIARQLRLRNLSGIIIVDFINLEEKASEQTLMHTLRDELARDPIQTKLVDLTRLSLVEITRMKKECPLAQSIAQNLSRL